MDIKEINICTELGLDELKRLMEVLSPGKNIPVSNIREAIESPSDHVYAVFDGAVIAGCATLGVYHSPQGKKGAIEDVVVLPEYRGQGLGRLLLEHILEEARNMAPIELHLTSRPSRVAANALYQSLGFARKETNAYILHL